MSLQLLLCELMSTVTQAAEQYVHSYNITGTCCCSSAHWPISQLCSLFHSFISYRRVSSEEDQREEEVRVLNGTLQKQVK